MCLLEAMRHISYERGFSIGVAHYNHELRGEESDRDETFVMDICEAHGLPFYSGRGDVKSYAKKNGLSIEEAARDMRYDFFFATAANTGAERIATAHTADDNAETMLINLIRGAGVNGMSGIPPVRDAVIRPLLRISREEVMSFVMQRGISFVEDSSNDTDIYTRNKIRHSIIPVIREINPRFNEAAAAAAELFRADEEFVADIADLFILECCIGLTTDAADLATLPFSVSSRVIRKLYNAPLSLKHVKSVLALCVSESPSASVSLPGMTVYREYDRLIFGADTTDDDEEFAPVFLADGETAIILGLGIKISCKSAVFDDTIIGSASGSSAGSGKSIINTSFTSFVFKSDDICGKIAVRPRREGDSIKLLGQSGTKSLKKLFIELRVPARKRALVPVIADDDGVLGIYGLGIGSRAVPERGDSVILIELEDI